MLIFIISNTEGVIVLVCPAVFGHYDGFCGRHYNHQAGVMPVYWLMFCQFCFCIWQMLLPFFLWQMLLPLLCLVLADVIAISLLADVIAIVDLLLGFVADVIATIAVFFVADIIATIADGIAIFVGMI